jgi:hypothetical protein
MSRARQHFRQTDVTKAIKAAVAAGLPVARVEVSPEGRIVIVASTPEGEQNYSVPEETSDDIRRLL